MLKPVFITIVFTFIIIKVFEIIGIYIYHQLKKNLTKKTKYKMLRETSQIHLLLGFFYVCIINFLIGVPVQVFHLSWNVYFWVMTFCSASMLLVSLIYYLKSQKRKKLNIKEHLKNYWFMYLVILVHTVISYIGNVHIYFSAHNDDSYYISRIVKNIGNPHIQQFIATFSSEIYKIPESLTRQGETYELLWSYLSAFIPLTTIVVVRMTLVPFILIIIYSVYYELIKQLFPKIKQKNIQYMLVFLVAFAFVGVYPVVNLSPYLLASEVWKFNFTVYYGSTVAFAITAPLTLIIYNQTVINNQNSLMHYGLFGCLCLFLLSFAPQFIPVLLGLYIYATLYVLIFLKRNDKWRYILRLFLVVVVGPGILFFLKAITGEAKGLVEVTNFFKYIDTYMSYIGHPVVFWLLMIFQGGLFLFLLFKKNKTTSDAWVLILSALFLTMLLPPIKYLLAIYGIFEFVLIRTGNSFILISTVISLTYCFVALSKKYTKNIVPTISIALMSMLLLGVVLFPRATNNFNFGYSYSLKALLNPEKIHPIQKKANKILIDDIDTRNLNYKPAIISPAFLLLREDKLLMYESNQQFLIADKVVDYNSAQRMSHFASQEEFDYYNPSEIIDFAALITENNGMTIISEKQIMEMKRKYNVEYVLFNKGQIQETEDIVAIGVVEDPELLETLIVYRIN